MPALFARLSRIVPLLAVLAFIAAVVYIVMSFRYSSERAKATSGFSGGVLSPK